jgi:hypothetical protein
LEIGGIEIPFGDQDLSLGGNPPSKTSGNEAVFNRWNHEFKDSFLTNASVGTVCPTIGFACLW